jgi:hypothetical protein
MKGICFRISIVLNTGSAVILWGLGFFGMLWMSQHHPSIASLFPTAMGGWTGGFAAILFKQWSNNKLDLDAAKAKVGPELTEIKTAAGK